jgi:serine/threonine protein kinase
VNIINENRDHRDALHPNLVEHHGSRLTETAHGGTVVPMVMEFVASGSLAGLLRRAGTLREPVATVYVRDVLCVLEYLHRSGVCHRDINSENILVSPEGRCDDRLRREQGPVSEYRGRVDDAQHLRRKMFGVSLFPKAHRSATTAGIIAPVRVRSTLSDGSRRRAQRVSVVFELVAFKDTVRGRGQRCPRGRRPHRLHLLR